MMTSNEVVAPDPLDILGVRVHPLSLEQLTLAIAGWGRAGRKTRVYNVNAHAMNIAVDIPEFHKALLDADLVYCDGSGVQLAARILGEQIESRLSVMDWLDDALRLMEQNGLSVYLIGDEASVVRRTADLMSMRYPGLKAIGFHHGFFEFGSTEEEDLMRRLALARPAVTFVGMGMPRQELWVERQWQSLPDSVYVPVGAAFTWYSGSRTRPPRWLRDSGWEWLGRLIQEPRRLGSRYLIGNPRLVGRAARERIRRSLRG